jgi:aldehyde:ferredoxin oxidoreductase
VNSIRGGFMGPILDIDLTTGRIETSTLDDEDRKRYLGGKILGAKLLWENLVPGTDALSPETPMIFTAGTLNGSNCPSSSRFNLSTRNVLTGGVATSNCGGDFGIWLRRAGYDGLVVRGKASRPTHIEITEDGVQLLDASGLWGKTTHEVQEGIPKGTSELVIGPAGENLVRYACILSGERALGRCGVGAVMGSKNLKLITAAGKKKLPVGDRDQLKVVTRKWIKTLKEHSITGKQLPTYGTAGLVSLTNATHTLTTRNFGKGHWIHADDVSGETLTEKHLVKNDGCRSCPIRCGRVVKHDGKNIKGPEFETVGMFGPSMLNRDMKKIIHWNWLADALGMDTITLGSTLACAMELHDRGLLPELPIQFDDHDGVEALIEDIAYRRGLGAELAEGSARVAAAHGAPELSMSSKGMEFAAYEPRGAVGHGLGYAVSNRGGCHINGGYLVFFEALGPVNMDPLTPTGKPMWVVFQQNAFEAVSAAGNCIFNTYAFVPDLPAGVFDHVGLMARVTSKALVGGGLAMTPLKHLRPGIAPIHLPGFPQTDALEALLGVKYRLDDFLTAGERGYTLERMINLREGLLSETDRLPPRLTEVPERPEEPRSRVPLRKMLPVYYKARGWDRDGIPHGWLLRKLGLDHLVDIADQIRENPDRFRARLRDQKAAEDETRRAVASTIGVPTAGRPSAKKKAVPAKKKVAPAKKKVAPAKKKAAPAKKKAAPAKKKAAPAKKKGARR